MWCNPPFTNPAPFVRKTIQLTESTPGATAVVLFPEWPGSETHTMLKRHKVLHRFPARSPLFTMTKDGRAWEMKPTRWACTAYEIHGQAAPQPPAQLQQTTQMEHPYIFRGKVKGTNCRVRTGAAYRVLDERQTTSLSSCATDEERVKVLADTGATHCLIPFGVVRQLDIPLTAGPEGRSVILGDNESGLKVLGTCELTLAFDKHETKVTALVIPVDWGSTQHLVLGSDWIRQNNVLIGENNRRGPQMRFGTDDRGRQRIVYARKSTKTQAPGEDTDPHTPMSACKFAEVLAQPYQGGFGTPWTAVDVSTQGVVIGDGPRIPLAEFLSTQEQAELSTQHTHRRDSVEDTATSTPRLQQSAAPSPPDTRAWDGGVGDPPPRTEAAPEGEAPQRYTPAGVPHETLQQYRRDFPAVFQQDLPEPTEVPSPVPETIHTIPLLPNAKPVFRRQWRFSPREREELEKQVKYMLAKGIIQPSSSPWAAPCLFTPKPDGSLRLCIDYRGLNAVTERDVFPLPRAADVFSSIRGKKIFSTLDLLKGYYQIWLHAQDRHLTAFSTPQGLFEFNALPMGLTNAPATFQRMMRTIFEDLIDAGDVMVYLDDILIMAADLKEHDRIMRDVLARLEERRLVVRFDKCSFGQTHVKFLGFIIGDQSIKADPDKLKAVQDWPVPDTVTAVRGFLGLANYFRHFIKGYATISAPLSARTGGKRGQKLKLTAEEIKSFEDVKAALVSPPVLAVEDPTKPYEVWTDASTVGIGAVLMQRDETGAPVVIAYESKRLERKRASLTTPPDPTTPTTASPGCLNLDHAALEDASGKQELAAVIHALKVWRCHLEGADFTVFVDHNPLTYLLEKKELNRWQVRMLDTLATYPGLKIRHIPGKLNIADGLSRFCKISEGGVHAGPVQDCTWGPICNCAPPPDTDDRGVATRRTPNSTATMQSSVPPPAAKHEARRRQRTYRRTPT